MEITLYSEITTEEALCKLEAEGEKYQGLWVDMDDAPQRKYIKENYALIGGLIKKIDRSRIDKTKLAKLELDSEAARITSRLEAANMPLSILLDGYKEKRAKILADEKARAEAVELVFRIATDHDSAIMEDKVRTFEAAEEARTEQEAAEQAAKDQAHRLRQAAEAATQREIQRQQEEKEAAEREQAKREADRLHVSNVLAAIRESVMDYANLNEYDARNVVLAMRNGKLPNVTINY